MLRDFQMIGRIGIIDEIQLRKEGSRGCELRIACSDYKNGEETTSWFSVTCFGKTAETVLDIYGVGDLVFLSGTIDMESWNDKQTGKERFKMKLKAFRSRRLSKGKASQESSADTHPVQPLGSDQQFEQPPSNQQPAPPYYRGGASDDGMRR